MNKPTAKQLYCMLWRWHFYAGLFAMPFIIMLSITGAIYLFKPQIDAFNTADYKNLTITGELASADNQVAAALTAVPGATFSAYQLPSKIHDAATIVVRSGRDQLLVYVHPQTLKLLGIRNEKNELLQFAHDLHGELLLGRFGSILVELAACWAIVLVLTGVYLWWPRNAKGLAGILYPRVTLKGRLFWRELHSVFGIWISCCVLFLLISGLPWAFIWGNAFNEVRALTGTSASKQDWQITGHSHHGTTQANTINNATTTKATPLSLQAIVERAQQLPVAPPVILRPPSHASGASATPWIKQSVNHWTISSATQNRPLQTDTELDAYTGAVLSHSDFSQKHIIDRVVGVGIAAHEGQLFGWLNQLLGLLTALGLVAMSIAGFIMWRLRAPAKQLGAPPKHPHATLGTGFMIIIISAAILLPALGLSLIALALLDFLVLTRLPKIKNWLGLSSDY